jgi:uncharacterized paraquat-inducible protein A
VSLHRGIDGPDPVQPGPVGRLSGTEEERRATRSPVMASGTLACPACDAPVAPPAGGLSPAEAIACPYCHATGPVRDFLSLAEPTRPARVAVVVLPPRAR